MANFSISEFKSQIDNMARANRFVVTFDSATQIYFDDAPAAEYLVKAIPIPTQENGEIVVNWFGLKDKRIGDIIIPDVTITFLMDEAFSFRKAMETWFVQAHDTINNVRGNEGYKASFSVEIFSTANEAIAKYTFEDCFPTSVGAVALSQTSAGSFQECEVTFSVDDFTVDL